MPKPLVWASVLAGVVACSHPRTRDHAPVPVDAVISFGSRHASEHVFSLSAPQHVTWLSAPTIAIPEYTDFGYAAVGDTSATTRPFVFIVRGRRDAESPLVIDGVQAGVRSSLGDADGSLVSTQPCIGANWVTAFFVEGIGAAPTTPVDVKFRTGRTVYTIRVDPVRHVMKLRHAARLRAEDVPTRLAADSHRIVSFRHGASLVESVPVIAARDDRFWRIWGRLSSTVESFDRIASDGRGTAVEWLFMLFETPPPCS